MLRLHVSGRLTTFFSSSNITDIEHFTGEQYDWSCCWYCFISMSSIQHIYVDCQEIKFNHAWILKYPRKAKRFHVYIKLTIMYALIILFDLYASGQELFWWQFLSLNFSRLEGSCECVQNRCHTTKFPGEWEIFANDDQTARYIDVCFRERYEDDSLIRSASTFFLQIEEFPMNAWQIWR